MAATCRHCSHLKHSGIIFEKAFRIPFKCWICLIYISFQKYYHFHIKLNSQNGCSFQNFTCSPNYLYLKFVNLFTILNVVFFLLGDSPASEFYIPTFQNALSVPSSQVPMKMEQAECFETSAFKFRCRGITQKREYDIQNAAEV